MSAPPGWHRQPDGRERWWDGQQWSEHFRTPPAPGQPAPGPPAPGGYPQPGGYPAPEGYPPPRSGMSSGAKGCLIAAAVAVVLLLVAVVVGGILFARTATRAVEEVQSALPSGFPTDLPTDGSTAVPSLGGDSVEVSVGAGFDLPRATIDAGWSVQPGSIGSEVAGMTATFTDPQSVPVVFSMSFQGQGSDRVETVCTATPESADATTAGVSCIPLFGDVDANGTVVVTPAF